MSPEPSAWREWMRAAQQGDRQAYGRLLRAVMPALHRAARALWPWATSADIEDAVQETLLALHAARQAYDPTRPFLPFVIGILRFRGADTMRRKRRTAASEVAIPDTGETFDAAATDTAQDIAADNARLREAIAQLPQRQRRALEMMKLEGLSLQEAASATGMSVTALKVATHRAIRSLRRLLGAGT